MSAASVLRGDKPYQTLDRHCHDGEGQETYNNLQSIDKISILRFQHKFDVLTEHFNLLRASHFRVLAIQDLNDVFSSLVDIYASCPGFHSLMGKDEQCKSPKSPCRITDLHIAEVNVPDSTVQGLVE